MKILSRDFSRGEKVLIALLVIVLVVLAYFQFVDAPVRQGLESAQAEKEGLQLELNAVNLKVADLTRMQTELDAISSTASTMASYNNAKAELDLLNEILADTQKYNISFSDVTRDGNQIRRNFALQFTVANYSTMKRVISKLADSEYRCLIDDIRVTANDGVTVNCTATFYETMVGGVEDAGLPEDSAAATVSTEG